MNLRNLSYLTICLVLASCRNYIEEDQTNYEYQDIEISDNVERESLYAVTNEEYLQYGSNVAYTNSQGDTIIDFGNYAYFGTDTLKFYANVLLHPNDSTYGRWVGIDRNENILFDLVSFDNGPDYFNEGLTRVQRNGKMGYANEKGQIVLSCQYDYAKWFNNGVAEVTYYAKEYSDMDGHRRVDSDSWFKIDKLGEKIDAP